MELQTAVTAFNELAGKIGRICGDADFAQDVKQRAADLVHSLQL